MRVVGEAFFDIAVGSAPSRRSLARDAHRELSSADQKGVIARDLFVFNADPGGGDGISAPPASCPHRDDLAARGMKLDAGMFKPARVANASQ